jgi:NAD(P)-dependent dehydrogenase (short-subunit alcohol dehydrogenase family)
MSRLAGRVALVTGAGQGSGRGCALALAAEGAAVALLGRTEATLAETAAEIARRGGRALPIRADVMALGDLEAAVARTVRELGPVKILVHAAQSPSYRSARLLEVSREVFDQLWASGPVAALELMRLCHPYLRGGGSIIQFGSGTQFAPAQYGAYAAAKAAIGMLTRAAAEEWGPDGIRANLVVPFVESPAFHEDFGGNQERLAASLRRIPLRRVGDPEKDLGRVVVFLASDDSAYVTGTTLMVEGGSHFLR